MITKFQHKYSVDEQLSIYLYDLIIKRNDSIKFGFSDYKDYELTDILVDEYNSWFDNGDFSIIENFIFNNKSKIQKFINNYWILFKPKVVLWSDRYKNEYFKQKLQEGFLFERYIYSIFLKNGIDLGEFNDANGQYAGENKLGVEIKNDQLIKKTGNYYIEYQEKSKSTNNNWINSGILKKDNTIFWIIGDFDGFGIFEKSILLKIYNNSILIEGNRFVTIGTSKGLILPKKNVDKYSISLECLIDKLKHKL